MLMADLLAAVLDSIVAADFAPLVGPADAIST